MDCVSVCRFGQYIKPFKSLFLLWMVLPLVFRFSNAELVIFDASNTNESSSIVWKTNIYSFSENFGSLQEGDTLNGSLSFLSPEQVDTWCSGNESQLQAFSHTLQYSKPSDLVISVHPEDKEFTDCAILRSSALGGPVHISLFRSGTSLSRIFELSYISNSFEFSSQRPRIALKDMNAKILWGFISDLNVDLMNFDTLKFTLTVDEHPWKRVLENILIHLFFRGVLGILFLILSIRSGYYFYNCKYLERRTSKLEQKLILITNGMLSFILSVNTFNGMFSLVYYPKAGQVSRTLFTQFFFCSIACDFLLGNIYEAVIAKFRNLGRGNRKYKRRLHLAIAVILIIADPFAMLETAFNFVLTHSIQVLVYPAIGILLQGYITLRLWYRSSKLSKQIVKLSKHIVKQNSFMGEEVVELPKSAEQLMLFEEKIRRGIKISRLSTFAHFICLGMLFFSVDVISPYCFVLFLITLNGSRLGNIYAQIEACNPSNTKGLGLRSIFRAASKVRTKVTPQAKRQNQVAKPLHL